MLLINYQPAFECSAVLLLQHMHHNKGVITGGGGTLAAQPAFIRPHMTAFISSELTPSLRVISFCNFLLGFMFHYWQIMPFFFSLSCAHTRTHTQAHLWMSLCTQHNTFLQPLNTHTHTFFCTHILWLHMILCTLSYWTTGC